MFYNSVHNQVYFKVKVKDRGGRVNHPFLETVSELRTTRISINVVKSKAY